MPAGDDRRRLARPDVAHADGGAGAAVPPATGPGGDKRRGGGWSATVLFEGRRIDVGGEGLTIGRLGDNELVIPRHSVSRRHARISPVPGGLLDHRPRVAQRHAAQRRALPRGVALAGQRRHRLGRGTGAALRQRRGDHARHRAAVVPEDPPDRVPAGSPGDRPGPVERRGPRGPQRLALPRRGRARRGPRRALRPRVAQRHARRRPPDRSCRADRGVRDRDRPLPPAVRRRSFVAREERGRAAARRRAAWPCASRTSRSWPRRR